MTMTCTTYTGADQVITAPSDAVGMTVKLWGVSEQKKYTRKMSRRHILPAPYLLIFAPTVVRCDCGENTTKHFMYKDTSLRWDSAMQYCASLSNGRLATVGNSMEQSTLICLMNRYVEKPTTAGVVVNTRSFAWIGGTRIGSSSTAWQWKEIDGGSTTATSSSSTSNTENSSQIGTYYWGNQPQANGDCMNVFTPYAEVQWGSAVGGWNADDCQTMHHYICEFCIDRSLTSSDLNVAPVYDGWLFLSSCAYEGTPKQAEAVPVSTNVSFNASNESSNSTVEEDSGFEFSGLIILGILAGSVCASGICFVLLWCCLVACKLCHDRFADSNSNNQTSTVIQSQPTQPLAQPPTTTKQSAPPPPPPQPPKPPNPIVAPTNLLGSRKFWITSIRECVDPVRPPDDC